MARMIRFKSFAFYRYPGNQQNNVALMVELEGIGDLSVQVPMTDELWKVISEFTKSAIDEKLIAAGIIENAFEVPPTIQ